MDTSTRLDCFFVPAPRQSLHGFATVLPVPPHAPHGVDMAKKPCCTVCCGEWTHVRVCAKTYTYACAREGQTWEIGRWDKRRERGRAGEGLEVDKTKLMTNTSHDTQCTMCIWALKIHHKKTKVWIVITPARCRGRLCS